MKEQRTTHTHTSTQNHTTKQKAKAKSRFASSFNSGPVFSLTKWPFALPRLKKKVVCVKKPRHTFVLFFESHCSKKHQQEAVSQTVSLVIVLCNLSAFSVFDSGVSRVQQMPARSPLSFSAGQQQTQEEGLRSRDHTLMMVSCLLATIFGLGTTALASYLAWVIFQFHGASCVLPLVGVVMTVVGCVGMAAVRQNAKDLKATQSPVMFVYIYGVILLIPMTLLVVVCCFSFDATLTR
jgi:hypothetical protein